MKRYKCKKSKSPTIKMGSKLVEIETDKSVEEQFKNVN